jgi:DNA-binding winged helix-turn-helix (wHTH) protein
VPSGVRFLFGTFDIDPQRRRLARSGEQVVISDRQLDVLLLLVGRAGQIVSKDDLLQAGWKDVAVGDNSLEQAISSLRRTLGSQPSGEAYIETVARRGYRFTAEVERKTIRETDTALDAILAPYRAFVEGRAALETLERNHVNYARDMFEQTLKTAPEHASAHIGMANACAMQFEMTRATAEPDKPALSLAVDHAREACRLEPQSAEAWATFGFVLDRVGAKLDALAAAKRAVMIEPDNWRHHFRLAFIGWGEERLSAAGRTLALLPDFPLAHWLAATVYVARGALADAERELSLGVAVDAASGKAAPRFSSVALHWLLGLLYLQRGDETRALEQFDIELSAEHAGHLYARECAANTWYAVGALKLRQKKIDEARHAFQQALDRIAAHPMAQVGLAVASGPSILPLQPVPPLLPSLDAALARAAHQACTGLDAEAARTIEAALADAPPGSAGWLLPIEPLLHVAAHPDVWARALAQLRNRAS